MQLNGLKKHGHFRGLSAQVHTTSKPLRSRSIASDDGGRFITSFTGGPFPSEIQVEMVEMVKFAVVDQSFWWLQRKISGLVYKEDLHSLKPTYPLKMDGWKMKFPIGNAYFKGICFF